MGGTLSCSLAGALQPGATTTVTVQLNPPAAPVKLDDPSVTVMTPGDLATPFMYWSMSVAAVSANQETWDVVDDQLYPDGGDQSVLGSGGVNEGGEDAFDEWGDLKLRVFDGHDLLAATDILGDFGLVYSPGHRWRTTTPVLTGTIRVARSLYAPANANWLRYVDTFTNTSGSSRTVWVAWGGDLGSADDTLTTASSSGDANIGADDTWAATIENDDPDPTSDSPLGYAWRSPTGTTYSGPGIFSNSVFTTPWPSGGNQDLGFTFKLVLAPGASASLAYFVYHGLSEDGGSPNECYYYGDCVLPAPGSQVALAETTAAMLAAQPNFCDLTPAEFAKIVNWPGMTGCEANNLYLPVLMR
ncbi:MAG: hypothetical protein ABI847_05910 [Anaerolineales bacterium]